jgi:sensor histidine kinase YesM
MQVRMGERLRFNVQNLAAVDPVGDFKLPPALVMTLVENAIKHGLEPSEFGGEITVLSELQGNQLHIVVRDTGVGFTSLESKDSGGGTGLSNITQRLQANYGDQASLELTSVQPHGCLALLKLPLHLISPQSN